MNKNNSLKKLLDMNYVDLMAFLKENNRPPGGEKFLYKLIQKTLLFGENKIFLHIACNNGYSTRLVSKVSNMKGIGIDINQNMINSAKQLAKEEGLDNKVKFQVIDARNLPFPDNSFNLVFSTGGTAFIENIENAVEEMIRVTKEGGFIADMVLFYKKDPPEYLIKEINQILGINIKKRDLNYWIDLYLSRNQNNIYLFDSEIVHPKEVSIGDVLDFCKELVYKNKYISHLSEDEKKILIYRLFYIFSLFAENHKYLSSALLIFKKEKNYQKSLFKWEE